MLPQSILIFRWSMFIKCVGDSLAILRAELKSQKKHVRNLKKKSLWSKILEEVMEKLVDIVHFLYLEIREAFGSAGMLSRIARIIDYCWDGRLNRTCLLYLFSCLTSQTLISKWKILKATIRSWGMLVLLYIMQTLSLKLILWLVKDLT